MVAAWEYENKKAATWYTEPNSLHNVYRELIARLPDRKANLYNMDGADKLDESYIWMAWFGGKQKAALKGRHKLKEQPKKEKNIDLGDTEIVEEKVYVGQHSKWGNPFTLKNGCFDFECKSLYPAHFWANNLYNDLDELFDKRIFVGYGEEKFHFDFLKTMIEYKKDSKNEEKSIWPSTPPIHLYNLLRRRIYLEIVQDEDHRIGELVFHIFDINDELTFKYVSEYIKTIFEFMTYHRLARPFSINIHTWSDEKRDLYEDRFLITLKTIIRQRMFTFGSNTDDKFKKDMIDVYEKFFKGYNFKSLNIDRFLYEKGKYYWTKPENLTLFNNSGKDWKELVQKNPKTLNLKEINDVRNGKIADTENKPENAFNEDDDGFFDLSKPC